ncbi:MAG: prepilin-type N-terminal cleavage/methylation domain-containing protein, partial [SAR202 cluster bacterium]|nr:prepilin-type N-terminal cleavage/methylation domain-containing protein [SAR202 cluster bacterium]
MARFLRSRRGLSLIELAVVLAIMGVLAAIVVPNVGGFLGTGQEQSYTGDKRTLQTAVNGSRTDSNNVGNKYPTEANFLLKGAAGTNCGGTGIGTPSDTCKSWIDIDVLVNGSGTVPGG